MKSLLIHGCYDLNSFRIFQKSGAKDFAFDIRPDSPNLITFNELKKIVETGQLGRVFLSFSNTSIKTIHSYLNLFQSVPLNFITLIRGSEDSVYLENLGLPFFWMFHEEVNLPSILKLTHLRGIHLPLKFKDIYQYVPELWEKIESENIEVFVHAENIKEACELVNIPDINMSFDLTSELEESYRKLDESKIENVKFFRRFNESTAGQ